MLKQIIADSKPDRTVKAEIWSYSKGLCKGYVEDKTLARQIAGWKNCQLCGSYFDKAGRLFGCDIIFPSRLYNRVAELLELPKKLKNLNRVHQGQRISETLRNYRFLRNTKIKQAPLARDYSEVGQLQ